MLKLIAHNGLIKFGSLKYYSYICIMKITTYGHAIIIMCIGLFFISTTSLLSTFFGGCLVGYSLRLARRSGAEDN